MLTMVNAPDPCGPNTMNAAKACAECNGTKFSVQSGTQAISVQLPVEEVVPMLIDSEYWP